MQIVPIEEHQLLVFWVQLVVLVLVARALGSLMRRIGQPAVIGELGAGLLLGPSVFARVWPAGAEWLFPPDPVQSGMLLIVGWVGIVMLLVITGFETDLALIRQLGRAAAAVAAGSLIVPFVLGIGTGFVLPGDFMGEGVERYVFALFLGAALSISSLPVIAKILSELGLTRRTFGQLTIAAAMANDLAGWLALGVIASLARGSVSVTGLLVTIGGMALFLAFAFTFGQRLADRALRRARAREAGVEGALAVTLVAALLAAALTQAIGVEAVLGAFIAGIVLGRSKFQDARVLPALESVTLSVFAPLFFATAGLRVDLGLLADPTVLLWAVVVVLVASLAKLAGAYLGGRVARLARQEAVALGLGLNARGALEIVIATVGLSLGVLNQASYTVIVLMAMATSMAAPPLLRAVAGRWRGTEAEQQRLEREETLSSNLLIRSERVLLPVQVGESSVLAARILDDAWPAGQEVTVLAAGTGGSAEADQVAQVIERRPVEVEILASGDPAEVVIEHLRLGYGALVMGAGEGHSDGVVTSSLTDELLSRSTVPTIVVREGQRARVQAGSGFPRVLVPVIGTVPNVLAQEVGASMCAHRDSTLWLLHVEPAREPGGATNGGRTGGGRAGGGRTLVLRQNRRQLLQQQVLRDAENLARRLGAAPRPLTRQGADPAQEILTVADELDADLVVLGSELRSVLPGQPFLGHLVEHLLENLHCTVAVVATPPQWLSGDARSV